MSRLLPPTTAAAVLLLAAQPAVAGDAYTTRIEPRPFYGATVTLEEGVRVFRALPAQRHVIINPDSKTPLSLNFTEERRISNNYNYFEGNGGLSGSGYPAGYSGGYPVYGTPANAIGSDNNGMDNGAFPGVRKGFKDRHKDHHHGPKIIHAHPGGFKGRH